MSRILIYLSFIIVALFSRITRGLLHNTHNRCNNQLVSLQKSYSSISGQRWGEFEGFQCKVIDVKELKERDLQKQTHSSSEATVDYIFRNMGDYDSSANDKQNFDDYQSKQNYNLNVGRALEALRRELPMIFLQSNLDFSIFANQILVNDGNNNRIMMQKSLYSAAVKSLKLASSFSSIYPSMNVKKIEYVDDCSTIQCLVDVVLPDSIRVDGQAVWEGMFYFGLDSQGLISSHTFDRKISNMRPNAINLQSMPWLRASPKWSSDLIGGSVARQRGLLTAFSVEESEDSIMSGEKIF